MNTYIALLRGINVSGQKLIKMHDLRAAFESMGFADVQTYIQSGNVVFKSGAKSTDALSKLIVGQINRTFGFDVPVLVRTNAQMKLLANSNPFVNNEAIPASELYVAFLSAAAPANTVELLQPLATTREQIRPHGSEIYLRYPSSYGQSKLTHGAIEKKLSLVTTIRNWNTVNALVAMAAERA
jgi:uncharacterized protein (DUF1697 family)